MASAPTKISRTRQTPYRMPGPCDRSSHKALSYPLTGALFSPCSVMLFCSSAANCSPDGIISLDAVSATLGVERRRIYDVTNILEALDMVSRKTKNAYIWHGTTHIAHTVKTLRVSALRALSDALFTAPAGPSSLFFHPFSLFYCRIRPLRTLAFTT
jgi:E2F/DP family winged-helix DNA-binding domain